MTAILTKTEGEIFVPAEQSTLQDLSTLFSKITAGGNQYAYERHQNRYTNTLINPVEDEGYIHITTDSAEDNNGVIGWVRIMEPSEPRRGQRIKEQFFLEQTFGGKLLLRKPMVETVVDGEIVRQRPRVGESEALDLKKRINVAVKNTLRLRNPQRRVAR